MITIRDWKIQLALATISICLIIQFFRLDVKPYKSTNTDNENKLTMNEAFENKEPDNKTQLDNKTKLSYLEVNEASSIYKDSPYITNMNTTNVLARTNHNNKELCVKQYNSSIRTISKKERKYLEKLVNNMLDKLESENSDLTTFIKLNLINTRFAKGNRWLEHGLPHTHPNIIILPPNLFETLIDPDVSDTRLLTDIGSTIIHELVHINQRIDPSKYNDLYNKWNFKKAVYLDNMEIIIDLNRHNPDAMDIKWIWYNQKNKQYYWIGAVFKNKEPNNLQDVHYLAYPVYSIGEDNYKYIESSKPIHLSEFSDFMNYFGINNNHYHPNEIVAQYMEYYYLDQMGLDGNLNMLDKDGYRLFLELVDKKN